MSYSSGPLDTNYDRFWSTYNPESDYDNILNDINNMGLMPGGGQAGEATGFMMDFNELNDMFNLLGKDIYTDSFDSADRAYLDSIGLDANAMVTDAFGANANSSLDNFQSYDLPEINRINLSASRKAIIADMEAAAESRLEAAAEELYYQQQKRSTDAFRNEIDKFRGFLSAGYEIVPGSDAPQGVGSYFDKENASKDAYEQSKLDYQNAVDDFVTDPGYDGRFHDAEGNFREELVDDYTYAPYAKTEEETKELVEKNLLNIEGLTGEGEILDSGERATALGKFIAIGLDAIGYADIGTKLYLTQSTWNATVNAIEGAVNKIFGTAYDFNLTFNAHELAAGLLNEKFVDKDGKPILSDIADKAGYLIPFASPEFSLNLAYLGGDNLMSYTPTGETLIDNMVDNLLEGQVYDRVQELSDEGAFRGIESSRGRGIMGFVDDVGAFIQKGGAEIQKIFSPGISQAIVDFAFFDGLPGGAVLAGIGQTLGPQTAEQWVRYLESKGLDKNNVEEKDISYYRALIDEFFADETYEGSGITNFEEATSDLEGGGYVAKYLNALDEHMYQNYGLAIDALQPADLVSILYKESSDAAKIGEANAPSDFELEMQWQLYDILADADPTIEKISLGEYLQQEKSKIQDSFGVVDIGNGFEINPDLVKDLRETTGLMGKDDEENAAIRARLEDNFEYIISDGVRGERLDNSFYDSDLQLNTMQSFESTSLIDPDTIIMPDVNVVGYNFEYLTNPSGPDVAYDPLSGVSYEFQQDRFINNPGQQEDRYLFPSATLEDLRTSNISLNGEKLRELAKQGRVEYGELLKYAKENPYAYLETDQYSFKKDWVQKQIKSGSGIAKIAVFEGPMFYDENGSPTQEFNDLISNNPELLGAWGTGTGNTGSVYGWARAEGLPTDRLVLTSEDLERAGIDPYSTPELNYAGNLGYTNNKVYDFIEASDYVVTAYNDPAVYAENVLQGSDIGEYFIKKYTGDIDEGGKYQDVIQELRTNYGAESLAEIFERLGYTDSTGDVALGNTDYVEDYTEDTIYRLQDYEIFNSNVTYYENGGYYSRPETFVEDLSTGIVELYDEDKVRDGKYNFKAGREYDFVNTKVRTPDGGFAFRDRDALIPVLKNLYARGLITMDQYIEADRDTYIAQEELKYTKFDNYGNPIDDDGNAMVDIGNVYDNSEIPDIDASGEFVWMQTYEIPTDTTVSPIEDGFIFADLPDFNVSGLNNVDDLDAAYQGRLEFINQSNFNYEQKDFLRQSAFNLYKSREAFIDLDESSQQLILDAQEEATSDFVDLGVFNVTSTNRRALDTQLNARMDIINAADLSEGQKQYEIDLANAIYNSKLSEINTLTSKNLAINTAVNARDIAIQREGAASQTATDLQARIDKIEAYEIPEFNVTAYMNAEDPSAYMQNFVDEVMKGTTEEFGNFLSASNADQILDNVAALAQSETDLEIAETAQQTNYDNYQEYLRKYNTANSELTTANQTLEANKIEIAELKADLYVELDNFEVTATDINVAQSELDAFNQDIDNRVTNGEITSEQGELEKSLATNTFNVYKATQDIASLQTSKDTAVAKLEDDLRIAKDEAASFEAEADDFEEKFNTAKAQYEATQSFTMPDFNVYSAMEEMGYDYSDEKGYFENPLGLEQVATRDAWVENYEESLRDKTTLSEQQISDIIVDVRGAIFARQSRAFWKGESKKHEGDLAEAQSRIGELESYTLPDFTVEGVPAENLDNTLSAYEQALTNDKNAGLINQEQYDTLYSSASELVQGEKDYIVAEENYADKEKKLTDKYNALQAQYTDYELPNMTVTGADFSQAVQSEEIGYYPDTVDGYNVWRMPDVPAEWTGTPYEFRKSLREQLVSTKREEFYDAEGNSVLTEAQIDDLMNDYRYAIEYWQSRQGWYLGALQRNVNYDNLVASTNETIRGLEQDLGNLQTFSLPEFNITATNQVELDAYLNRYQGYVDQAEKDENISAEQALNFDTIIASIRNNGSQIFNLEAANKTKQDKIDDLEGENTGLRTTIGDNEQNILDLTGTISVIGSGFDVNLYDDISDLDAGLASYIQGINDSDLDEEMKASQIAFAESMADMRRENLFVPTYEAPDFNVIAEGDLTGLNQSYSQAMFTLDSFLGNEYITQEEYDANVSALNESYNTRKETLVPAYTLPEFTVSDLDAEGGFTNLDAEKEEFLNELQSFLDNDYITREEHDALEAQIESAYDTKKRDITPVYEAPDFTVYGQLEPGGTFEDIDAEYNTAFDELTLNARLGYISTSDYITQLNDLQTSYEDARKGIAPAYELPDFSVYGQIAEGDDTTEIDTAYQNELTRLEEYKDSGYISLSDYYGFLGDLETEYTSRREGILPTYTMPDFGVTPASSLAELAEMEQAALDRFEMFSKSEYFPEDFDILTEQQNLQNLIDAERARIQGTYTLPEFAVTDTQGVLTQKEIEDLFGEYESGLQQDVLNEMLGFDDFMSAMDTARGTFEFEYDLRKPIQPRPGDYAIIPDPINEGDQPSTGDFLDFVDDGGFPDQTLYGGTGGIDTSGILTGNYMAKLDPAYQLAEMLLGQDAAREMYPTGKSRGLADEEFQGIVNQFMLGQAEAGFEMQSGLSGKMQDLATEQRRLQRQSDLDLMSEFGDPYKKQLEELYPEQAAALKQQREIADISAERAKGDLSPREQAQVEQQGYLYGAGRGREFDPVGLYQQLGEESSIRQQRETQATNQLTSLMNMERGMYGDLPSVIGAQSPFIEGVGDIQTPFNIGGIMDLGSVDYANQQRLQEVNMAIAQLDRDYQTAVALNQPSKAQSTLVKLNEFKAQADALSAGLSSGAEAFGTLKSIGGGIMNIFNRSSGSTNTNSFNYGSTTPVDYTDKGSFERYLFGMGF